LSAGGFSEIFVDQVDENIVAITRHNPKSHESILLIANTCFDQSKFKWSPQCRPLFIADEIAEILFELKTVEEEPKENGLEEHYITGLPNFRVECYQNVPLNKSDAIEIVDGHQIQFKLFVSGSVVALK
jgi:glycogen debranching enzyme